MYEETPDSTMTDWFYGLDHAEKHLLGLHEGAFPPGGLAETFVEIFRRSLQLERLLLTERVRLLEEIDRLTYERDAYSEAVRVEIEKALEAA